MFSFDKSDIQRVAVSGLGALALTTVSVFGAAAPVKAQAPVSAPAWSSQVAKRAAAVQVDDDRFAPASLSRAEVTLRFTADGDFAGAGLARSSGNKVIDARAVKVAGRIAYPRLPASLRGRAQEVTMRLFFGDAGAGAAMPTEQGRVETVAARGRGVQVAAR